jgi:superfamily I DNA/RNA helicase
MIQDLQLAGRGERTQEAYVRAVRKLATHFHQSPDQLTETQIRDYFLYLKNDCKFSPSALKIAHSGIKFFYTHSMPREWATLLKLRVPKHKTLPDVPEDRVLTIQDLTANHGLLTTAPWDEALEVIPNVDKVYFKACMRRGEDLSKTPRIRISTIHSAKGAEATNVLLVTDFPQKMTGSVRDVHDMDDEKRVFYVGLTRAKKELHLVHPMTTKGFPLP